MLKFITLHKGELSECCFFSGALSDEVRQVRSPFHPPRGALGDARFISMWQSQWVRSEGQEGVITPGRKYRCHCGSLWRSLHAAIMLIFLSLFKIGCKTLGHPSIHPSHLLSTQWSLMVHITLAHAHTDHSLTSRGNFHSAMHVFGLQGKLECPEKIHV